MHARLGKINEEAGTNLLTDGVDVSARDLVVTRHEILHVNLVAQIHLGRDSREDETFLATVRSWELNLNMLLAVSCRGKAPFGRVDQDEEGPGRGCPDDSWP